MRRSLHCRSSAAWLALVLAACGGGGSSVSGGEVTGAADDTADAVSGSVVGDVDGREPRGRGDGQAWGGGNEPDEVGPEDAAGPAPDLDSTDDDGDAATDPGPLEGAFGWPCVEAGDCHSGYCLPVAGTEGSVCTETCQIDCPHGFICKHQPQFGDVVFLCVPLEDVGCKKPCFYPNTFQDCGVPGALCADVDGLNFCLEPCDTDSDCDADHTCVDMLDDDDFPLGRNCWPDSGSCECGTDVDLTLDPANCGYCGHVCAVDNAQPVCQQGDCGMGPCSAGWTDLNGLEDDGCEYECAAEAIDELDLPDPAGLDSDCDGLDGELEQAVFVSPSGTDAGNASGGLELPFASIQAAINFAASQPDRTMVLVAAGTYIGKVQLESGVHVAGGYDGATWERDPDKLESVIFAEALEPSGAMRGLVADGITAATRLTAMTIRTANNPAPGGPTQALWLRNCGPLLELIGNRVAPGDGGAGLPGSPGADGNAGVDGLPGQTGGPENWFDPQIEVQGGTGGDNLCPDGSDTTGGAGGRAGWGDDPLFASEKDAQPGEPSAAGVGGGPAGGTKSNGDTGGFGVDGDDGAPGLGGAADGTADVTGIWLPAHGTDGTDGTNGQGGGGGGGGGGGMATGGIIPEHAHGGGGGGGGSGGCGGTGGSAGGGGGGSFGVFIVGGGPTLADNVFVYGTGGAGGDGGKAGKGGQTGYGGEPGEGHGTAGDGGWGGKGGKGGKGGHAGGGGGGPSVAIYLVSSQPTCTANITEGSAKPGDGGSSSGTDGAAGLAGKVAPVVPESCQP